MSVNLGIDIGAISLKLAAVGAPEDRRLLEAAGSNSPTFRPAPPAADPRIAGLPILISSYRRIQGSPMQSTFDLLHELYDRIPEEKIEGIRVTGSGSQLIAKILGIYFENEFKAIAKATPVYYPQARTVFEMGGGSSKYILLDEVAAAGRLGILDYSTSGDCAAGTGSFLDQQASRLLYNVEEIGEVVCGAGCSARIAGRCSVFAKSDMIHAQQKGYSVPEILKGLCEAVARNFRSSIVKGKDILPPVMFIGGVAWNRGVLAAFRDIFKLNGDELFVPELHAWLGAIGAALLEKDDWRKRSFKTIHQLQQHEAEKKIDFACTEPLTLRNVVLLRDRVKPYRLPQGNAPIPAYLGIDIGSVSTNLAVIDEAGELMHDIYLRTQGRPIEQVSAGLKEIEEFLGDRILIQGSGTTGSGRELIGELVGADTVNDEITAHKTGAMYVSERLVGEQADTIFEIGGQDSKFILIQDGIVVDFAMNEACAAGTGSFLEEQAEKLGVQIKGEFAELALQSRNPARLGERCTVFMERDLTAFLHRGARVGDLCAGLAYSVVLNYLNRIVRGRKIGNVIFFQGGTAYNDAVAAAFSQILGKRIIVPPHNGVIGAIGMALIARERFHSTGRAAKFRGYDLNRVGYTAREFVCKACSNYCDMKEFTIEGEKSYWGDKCSDKFRKRARTDRQPVIEDLMAYRDRMLEEGYGGPQGRGRKVGITRSMYFFDRFPFWFRYLEEIGFDVVVSDSTDRMISTEGADLAVAEPCFPVKVAHGHVQSLLGKGVDYILLPNALNAELSDERVDSHMCPWNQTLPFVLRAVSQFTPMRHRMLVPTVHFRLGKEKVKRELAEFGRGLGISRKQSDRGVEAGYAAQGEFRENVLRAGRQALAVLENTGEPAILLVGRAYNVYDRSVNCDIPRKLRAQYGVNVLPMEFLPLEGEDISDVNDNMYWSSGQRILAAGKMARRSPNLHVIFITNFKCGPDSYIKSFLFDACAKPYLILQFDGHSNDAGFLTRCEAYLDSKGILRCVQRKAKAAAATA